MLLKEMKRKAPTLLSVLKAAGYGRHHATPAIIGMAASILLNGRNQQMSLPQSIVSVLLYIGHCAKMVYVRLKKLGVCVSHKRTTQLIKLLGENHDQAVIEWKELMESSSDEMDDEMDLDLGESDDDHTSNTSQSRSTSTMGSLSGDIESDDIPKSSSTISDTASTLSSSVVADSVDPGHSCSYILVGDNLDKTVSPRDMRSDNQRRSIHYFHLYGALDRVNCAGLADDRPVGNISELPLSSFIPSSTDCKVLVERLHYFAVFRDCVDKHIQHKHSLAMKQKSKVVPLGIIPRNENKTDEMMDILKIMHDYVPGGGVQQVAFGGDQLTAARARKCQQVRVNSPPSDALRGLVPFASDWHAKVNFMEVIWNRLHSSDSSMDGGTLHQLRNLINRVNVGRGKEIKHHVNEVEDFLVLVISCHLIAAALHYFSMESVSDVPHTNGFPEDVQSMELYQRKKLFYKRMEQIIDEYVVPREFAQVSSTDPVDTGITASDSAQNPHVLRIQQEHLYTAAPPVVPQRRRQLPSTVTNVASRPTASVHVRQTAPDDIFNYASAVLNDGLLLLELKDAIREGDGDRILRCWKVLLLYYRSANRTNYSAEAFHFLAKVNTTASQQTAQQLVWSRVVNVTGKEGHNVPVDMHMEHLNRTVKGYVAGLGANVSESTIIQCGVSLNGMMAIAQNFDRTNAIHRLSSTHTRRSSAKDEERIVQELTEKSRVFDYIPGRTHSCKRFHNIQPNVATKLDKKKLLHWLAEHKKQATQQVKFANLYGHKM